MLRCRLRAAFSHSAWPTLAGSILHCSTAAGASRVVHTQQTQKISKSMHRCDCVAAVQDDEGQNGREHASERRPGFVKLDSGWSCDAISAACGASVGRDKHGGMDERSSSATHALDGNRIVSIHMSCLLCHRAARAAQVQHAVLRLRSWNLVVRSQFPSVRASHHHTCEVA